MERDVTTIQDVARAAGVAPSTVSRYLNGQLRVSPATEAKVLEAVSELGYVPNAQARNLARRRSGVIGFVVPEISNPYFGDDRRLRGRGGGTARPPGTALLAPQPGGAGSPATSSCWRPGPSTACSTSGSFRSNERLATAIADGLAVVVVDEPIAGLPPVHTVVMDDYAGGYQATSYLAALGHRKIAFVSGPAELGSVQERYRGYSDALTKAGIDPSGQVSQAGQFTEQFGMSALPHLLAAAEPPTAAFVASDYIALGVLSAAEAHGIRVPEDLSIVGFDDIRFSQYVRPRLTTIRSPVDRLAQVGVELLFERLADPEAPARTEVLPVELVIRESAGAGGRPVTPVTGRSDMRVLLCGESWVTHSLHIKGVDSFTTSAYVEGAGQLRAALSAAGIEAEYLPGHLVPGQFPGSAGELARYDAVILSDIGANSLLLSPGHLRALRRRAEPARGARAVRARRRRAADDRRVPVLRRHRGQGEIPPHPGRGCPAGGRSARPMTGRRCPRAWCPRSARRTIRCWPACRPPGRPCSATTG